MINSDDIRKILEKKFGFNFDVFVDRGPSLLKYKISLFDSAQHYFVVTVEIKNSLRLTIESEPDKYGVEYLKMINHSSLEKRQLFVKYWKTLIDKKNKVKVKINDFDIDFDQFYQKLDESKTFNIRVTKSPFYNDNDNKDKCIIDNIVLVVAMMITLMDYEINGFVEGTSSEKISTVYERNPLNRELCLSIKGYTCECCGFNFEEKYGPIGSNFIEVHHIIPVSTMGDNYVVDPIKDLVPVCSNCHAMLHKKNPPFTIEEMQKIIKDNEDVD